MTIEHLPATLRKARRDRGLTLHQVAEKTGVSYAGLSDIETGKQQPTLKTLERLATAYDLELSIMLGPAGSWQLGELTLSAAEIRELRRWFQERLAVREAMEGKV